MLQKKSSFLLTSGLGLLTLGAVLAACNASGTGNPATTVSTNTAANPDSSDAPIKQAIKPSKPKVTYRTVQPGENPPFSGRAEAILGSKRIKGQIPEMQDNELQTTIKDYNFDIGTDTNGDGAANEHAESQLEISGFGKDKLVVDQENYPVMSNQLDSCTVKDATTGNLRIYKADQDLFNYSVSDGSAELSVKSLPDGSWTVNGEAAATPAAVAELAMKSPIVSKASVHGLMLIYQAFNQAGKVPVTYVEETLAQPINYNGGHVQKASGIGDPKPLLKEVIKLKLKLHKP